MDNHFAVRLADCGHHILFTANHHAFNDCLTAVMKMFGRHISPQ